MDENFCDNGPVVSISPYAHVSEPNGYAEKLAAAKKLLGSKYCLSNPRYATNKNRLPAVIQKPKIVQIKGRA